VISLRSEITRRVLNYFFINPQDSLYVNELARKLELDKRNLVKKARELEERGILKSHSRGNLKLYSINTGYHLYKELKNIFLKTVGFQEILRRIFQETKGVKSAYIYGSYARDKLDSYSDIDLLVIGKHDALQLQKQLSRIQREIGREINVINMGELEFRKRLARKDPFISGIIKNRHIRLKP
jgi:predicted nucleotidyltransferase